MSAKFEPPNPSEVEPTFRGETYGHALAVAELAARADFGRARAAEEFSQGQRDLLFVPEDLTEVGVPAPAAYRMRLKLLICGEQHDQTVCCSEHGHHLHKRISRGPGGTSCSVCRSTATD